MKGLGLLAARLNAGQDVSIWSWATVTDDSPLRVKLDGEPSALAVTPDTLVAGLAVDDRVWVQQVSNTNPARRYRRIVIHGRSLGPTPNVKVYRHLATGSLLTNSTSYADVESTANMSWVKRIDSSGVLLSVQGAWFFSFTDGGGFMALRINGTDYPLVNFSQTVPANTRVPFAGEDTVSGIPAGTYTVQARWRCQTTDKTVRMDNVGPDYISIKAMEIFS